MRDVQPKKYNFYSFKKTAKESVNVQETAKRSNNHAINKNHSITSQSTSKLAKFSSLFKNNHEIPRVGE